MTFNPGKCCGLPDCAHGKCPFKPSEQPSHACSNCGSQVEFPGLIYCARCQSAKARRAAEVQAAARAAQAPQGDTRQGDEGAVLSALRNGVPLQEPVSITKAVLAQREARVSLSGGTGPVACAMLVNIQLTPWAEGAEKAEAFASGFNTAMKWYRSALLDLEAHTCTPADERAVIERAIRFIESGSHTHIARDTMTDELRKLLSARAAQGVGTAPVPEHYRKILAMPDGPDVVGPAFTPPDPVSTAAATTASASESLIAELDWCITNGAAAPGMRTHAALVNARAALAPSRTADGQQGASQAVESPEQQEITLQLALQKLRREHPKLEHPDQLAVRKFAFAMEAKMAVSRGRGRSGWDDPKECPISALRGMLLEHLPKGDPVDVANFCMMLWNRGAKVVAK
jgi:hypothetical protein